MSTLSWLHLSDWHQRGEDFDRQVVRDKLLEDIQGRTTIDPCLSELHFIVFSGDAAFRGLETEFKTARKNLFDPVLTATSLEPQHLFFAPGNHDLNREVIVDMLPTGLQTPLTKEEAAKWLTDGKKCARALEPFEDYSKFVKGYTGQRTPEFASIRNFSANEQKVALLSLNSAWMCGRHRDEDDGVNDYGYLNIGESQIHEAIASIQDADVRIAVVHHPFAWLQEYERRLIEDRLQKACHFILRGHEHEPNFNLAGSLQGECAMIPAGACYERRKAEDPRYVNAYNLVHLDLATGKGMIFFRRWSERRTQWIEDTDTCDGGKHEFDLPKELGQPRATGHEGHTPPSGPDLASLEKEYRRRTIEFFKDLSFRGLTNSVRPILLPLEKVYVQLRAVAEVPESADEFTPEERRILRCLENDDGEGLTDTDELQEAHMRLDALRRDRWTEERLERFPIAEALSDPERRGLVILGDPGSGKSTLLNFLALVYARGPEAVKEYLDLDGDEGNRLAILAPLAAYDDMLNRMPSLTLRDFLAKYYAERRSMPGLAPPFELAMDSGRALVLLDGLDEVLDEGRRKFVADQAGSFVRALIQRGNRVLLTSRIYGYRTAPLSVDVPHITVLDFRQEEIELFARQWNTAIAEWEYGDRSITQRLALAQDAERRLLAEIQSNPGIQKLAANPLLLSMLALLRRQVGRLPQQRIRLYARYLEALIDAWESSRSPGARLDDPERPDAGKTDLVLIPLALWLQNHRPSGTATEAEILRQITTVYLREDGLPTDTPQDTPEWAEVHARAREFLADMRQFSGVLVERGHDAFGFRHLTFQEYYVGRALARMTPDDRWSLLRDNLHANRWREPILLAAGQLGNMQAEEEKSTALVSTILAAKSAHEETLHRDLFLAADCAADDINAQTDTLRDIVKNLAPLALSPVPVLAEEAVRRLIGLASLTSGGRLRLPEAVDTLLSAAPTADSRGISLQAYSALAAGLFGQFPRLREALANMLEDKDESVRFAAICALAPLLAEQPPLREAVANMLEDEDYSVRHAAIRALAPLLGEQPSLREAVANMLEGTNEDKRRAAIRALAPLLGEQPSLREAVANMLDDEDQRSEAIRALAPLLGEQPSLREAVANMLEDKDESVRSEAIGALAPLLAEQPPLREAVANMLRDKDYDVRCEAIGALAPLLAELPPLREAVANMLEDEDEDVRGEAIDALAPLLPRQPPLREAVANMLEDKDEEVRREAIDALAPLLAELPPLREAVANMLEDRDEDVRSEAIRALSGYDECRQVIGRSLSHRDWRTRRETAPAFAGAGERMATLLDNLVCIEAASARRAAIRALASLLAEQPPLREPVASMLEDRDESVRCEAIRALAPLLAEQPPLRAAVANMLEDRDEGVRSDAIRALAPLLPEQPPLREAVANMLEDKDESVRSEAIGALAPLLAEQPPLREAVANKLEDKVESVRSEAIGALAPLLAEQPPLREAVANMLEDEYSVRREAITALAPLLAEQPPLREAVANMLEDKDEGVRSGTIGALAPLLTEQPPLREAVANMLEYRDEGVRSGAITALAPLLGEQPPLCKAVAHMLEDGNEDVRCAAIRALAPLLAEQPPLCKAVARMLEDEDKYVRSEAVGALAPLLGEHPPLREAVAIMLEDEDVRSTAISALAPLLGEQPPLCKAVAQLLEDGNEDVRCAAIRALAPLLAEQPPLREAVTAMLGAQPTNVRGEAIASLSPLVSLPAVRGQLMPALRMDNRRVWRLGSWHPLQLLVQAWGQWIADEPAQLTEVVEMLGSEDSRLRQSGAEILLAAGKDAVAQAVPQLLAAMNDHRGLDSWPARITAAELLINDLHFSRQAIDTLLPALEYGAHPLVIVPNAVEIRKSAALALGKLKAEEYRPEIARKLEELLETERNPQVLSALFNALHSLASAPG